MNKKIYILFALVAGLFISAHTSENMNNFGYLMWRKRNCVFL